MAQIIIKSDFADDADGWSAIGDVELFEYRASGGNPGGHVFLDDLRTTSGALRFVAPEKFLGDVSALYGGTLSFDLNWSRGAVPPWTVRFVSGSMSIDYELGTSVPANQWTRKNIPLKETSSWEISDTSTDVTAEQFRAVLADLQQILIHAEYYADLFGGGDEQILLDNVVMTSPELFDWRRLDSAQQTEGDFGTFAEAVAAATPGDVLVFLNPAQTALDLGNITIAVENLTVQGDVLLDGTFKLGPGIEDFILKSASQVASGHTNADVIGNARANYIAGSDGDNTINGGAGGGDLLEGRGGDDRYFVDSDFDRVLEEVGKGTDTIYTTTDFKIEEFSEVEFLRAWRATKGLELTGNEFQQNIYGGGFDDTIEGGGGADNLRGADGNDTYIVRNAGVRVVEAANQGDDSVVSSVDFILLNNVENLQLTGSAIKGLGNGFGNVIDGNAQANILQGKVGNDVLTGYGGNDRMTGGADADVFVLGAPGTGIDFVFDFSSTEGDRLAVFGSDFGLPSGPLDNDYFDYTGTIPNVGHGRFLWDDDTSRMFWDADGNAATSNALIARITTGAPISVTDFVIF